MEEKIMEFVDHAWQDSYMGTTGLSLGDFADSDKLARKPFVDVALVAHQPGSGEPNFDYSCVGKKYLWRRAVSHGLVYTPNMMPIIYQVSEDDLGLPGEAVGSVSPCFLLCRHDGSESADSRGVFPTNYRRKVLFTKKVKLKTSDLPRRKPKAIIGL
jgi:hypothetical protein